MRVRGIVLVAIGFALIATCAIPLIMFGGGLGIWFTIPFAALAAAVGTRGARRLDDAKLYRYVRAASSDDAKWWLDTNRPVETLNTNTAASDPTGVTIDPVRLRVLEPSLFRVALSDARETQSFLRSRVREQLAKGDSRAAICVSVSPLVVAAYTDELDCVVMVELPQAMRAFLNCAVGDRLLTVNTYGTREHGVARDLIAGPADAGRWGNVEPFIATAFSADADVIASRIAEIDEIEWQRCVTAAVEWQERFPLTKARDGRPTKVHAPR